jgi:hypothetical protein
LWNKTAAGALFERIKTDQVSRHRHRHRHAGSGGQKSVWQAKPKTAAQAACH